MKNKFFYGVGAVIFLSIFYMFPKDTSVKQKTEKITQQILFPPKPVFSNQWVLSTAPFNVKEQLQSLSLGISHSKKNIFVSDKEISQRFLAHLEEYLNEIGAQLLSHKSLSDIKIEKDFLDNPPPIVTQRMALLDLLELGLKYGGKDSVSTYKIKELLSKIVFLEISSHLNIAQKKILLAEKWDAMLILSEGDPQFAKHLFDNLSYGSLKEMLLPLFQ